MNNNGGKMSHSLIKRAALFTLLTFIFMIISANYSFATGGKFERLKRAEEAYGNGDYGTALRIVDEFIFNYMEDREKFKDEFCLAYLIKAKIYYDSEEPDKMTIALRNLFNIDIDYQEFLEEDDEFIKRAREIRAIVLKEKKDEPKPEPPAETEQKKEEVTEPEKPQKIAERVIAGPTWEKKKKKKFPVFFVVAGVAVAAAAVYFLTKKKKETNRYTLTVTKGEGVDGTPGATATYEEGALVSYNYTLQSGYKDLVVTLDGQEVATSGVITMDMNHTLNASATRLNQYTLTVTRGEGVNGTPETGTFNYDEGSTVNYNYSLQEGYINLAVTLDGQTVPSSGVVTMDSGHTLSASATKKSDNSPTVEITSPNPGETVNGTIAIRANANAREGKSIIKVEFYIDGRLLDTKSGGPFNTRWDTTENSNGEYTIKVIAYDSENKTGVHEITVNVNNGQTYTLSVVLQEGAQGAPENGNHDYTAGTEVSYSYSPKTGYTITSVKIDGLAVPASGMLLMDADHQLQVITTAAAQK